MAVQKSDSLDATGAGTALFIKDGHVTVRGTWTGTINVQIDPLGDGNWVNMTDDTGSEYAFTDDFDLTIDNGVRMKTRVLFTRTTGTAIAVLQGY